MFSWFPAFSLLIRVGGQLGNSDKFCLTGAWDELWKNAFNFGALHLVLCYILESDSELLWGLKIKTFTDEWLGWICTDTGGEDVLVKICSFWLGNSYLNIRLPFLLFWCMWPMTNDGVPVHGAGVQRHIVLQVEVKILVLVLASRTQVSPPCKLEHKSC